MTDLIETVTTIPLTTTHTGETGLEFWQAVLGQEEAANASRKPAKRLGDPVWAVVLVFLGALLLVGSGAFCITYGLSQ